MPDSTPSLLPGPGSTQRERRLTALHPATAPLDGRTPQEVVRWAKRFAEGLLPQDGSGPWDAYLPDPDHGGSAAEAVAASSPPQALFLAFLRCWRAAQREVNGLTGRHLEFFYRQVLGLAPRASVPDRADVVVSLKKNAREYFVPRGMVFTTPAGDRFAATADVVIHQAMLVHRRLIGAPDAQGRRHFAPAADSADGLGSPLPDEAGSWHPFGVGATLPEAPSGFAVASPLLWMKEGARTVTLRLWLGISGGAPPTTAPPAEAFSGSFSGEKAWLAGSTGAPGLAIEADGLIRLELSFTLAAVAPAVVPFDPTVLDGAFDSLAPVLRVHISSQAPAAVRGWLQSAEIRRLQLRLSVAGMSRGLHLENDSGPMDPTKPIAPFGFQPASGSSFYAGLDEVLGKAVTRAAMHLRWQQPPGDFSAYSGYANFPTNDNLTATLAIWRNGQYETLASGVRLFNPHPSPKISTLDIAGRGL